MKRKIIFINLPPSFGSSFSFLKETRRFSIRRIFFHEGKYARKPDEILIKNKSKQLHILFRYYISCLWSAKNLKDMLILIAESQTMEDRELPIDHEIYESNKPAGEE